MTRKELEEAKKSLPKWKDGKPPVLTEEQKKFREELFCISMINSILIYDGKNNIMNNRYLKEYVHELGEKRVAELVDEQIKDLKKSTVLKNIHMDDEGLYYHSIIWHDEKEEV